MVSHALGRNASSQCNALFDVADEDKVDEIRMTMVDTIFQVGFLQQADRDDMAPTLYKHFLAVEPKVPKDAFMSRKTFVQKFLAATTPQFTEPGDRTVYTQAFTDTMEMAITKLTDELTARATCAFVLVLPTCVLAVIIDMRFFYMCRTHTVHAR